VPRGASVVAAALPVACGALDKRCLVGPDTSDLSALACARAGTVSATLRTRKCKLSSSPPKPGAPEENATYLKVEKPRFLFLEGSTDAVVVPVVAAAALPDAPAALTGASAVHAASSTERPAAGASTPIMGACSFAASAALGEGSEGFHLSGGPPPIALLFLLSK
jgi:hypothetical protein